MWCRTARVAGRPAVVVLPCRRGSVPHPSMQVEELIAECRVVTEAPATVRTVNWLQFSPKSGIYLSVECTASLLSPRATPEYF